MSLRLVGPGAEPDLNWELVENDPILKGNQATDLPETNPLVLPIAPPYSEHTFRFRDWHDEVIKTLRAYNLHRLINSSIERPLRSDPNAEKWYRLSLQVSGWMMGSMKPMIVKEVHLRGSNVEFADDLMRELKHVFDCKSLSTMIIACFSIWKARRHKYKTISDFIAALQRGLLNAIDQNAWITPWHTFIIMMKQLDKIPSLHNFITVKNCKLEERKDLASEMTVAEFFEVCKDIRQYVKEKHLDSHECVEIDYV